ISDFFIDKELKYELLLDFLQQEKITKIFLDASIKLQFDGIDYCDIFYFQKGILPHSWFFGKNLDLDYKQDLNLSEQKLYQMKKYFLTLKKDEKKVILDFLSQNNDKHDLYEMLYYLINELYSFEHEGIFYQIIIDKEKMLMAQKHDKSFYPLGSFVYKPYLYELRNIRPFLFLMKILGLEYLGAIISHTKFYRLARKLFFNPKGFFEDLRAKKARN
ncbi:TPA: sugar transferase, partial [Campylobacter jejuni]|nr:sugar transferase [Campylobacter jejuni]EIB8575656.1 sugar transferase [Campylobacter jejuni]EJE1349797.1 sugar transferase [Campylobacter jejuni]ELV9677801.1 sugar transferase [Campylobacter jejuni]HEC2803747.1 sugar transferase [Campylobacter jejuni]